MANINTASALKSLASTGKRVVATQSDPLNLRQAPSTSSMVLLRIPRGATVDLLACTTSAGWTAVRYNTTEGFVSSQYLAEESSSAPTQESQSDVSSTAIVQQPTVKSNTTFKMPEVVKKYGKYVLIAAGVGIAGYAAYKLFKSKGGGSRKRSRSLSGVSRKVLRLK